MDFDSDRFPESTTDIALGYLDRKIDVAAVASWAVDVIAMGQCDDVFVDLSCLDADDWQRAERLLPKALAVIGYSTVNRLGCLPWIERKILKAYCDGVLGEEDLIEVGYAIWVRVMRIHEGPNPFQVYSDIGDLLSIETSGRGPEDWSGSRLKLFVVKQLLDDGAFDRTDLSPP